MAVVITRWQWLFTRWQWLLPGGSGYYPLAVVIYPVAVVITRWQWLFTRWQWLLLGGSGYYPVAVVITRWQWLLMMRHETGTGQKVAQLHEGYIITYSLHGAESFLRS